MKRFLVILCSLFLIFGFASSASADFIVFSDNFDTENEGVGVLNYDGFANWGVTDGTVDLIGNGFFDFLPGNGLYVDMDGSTGNAGKMTNIDHLKLAAGDYVLEFDLAGNHRNDSPETVTVQVSMGSLFSKQYSLYRNAPFTHFSEQITSPATFALSISFEGAGGDNIGMLLDNVKLTGIVPEPSSLLLIGLGLVGLVGFRRKV